jgi:hypothetical protein
VKSIKVFGLVAAFLLSSCVTLLPNVWAANALNSVVMAGKQRMLSQRVLKAYAQLGLDVVSDKARVILATSLGELKTSNFALREQIQGKNVLDLQTQEALIAKLSSVTATPATPRSVQQVSEICEDLLNNAETVTQAFIKAGAEAPSAIVNLAARQRMLSQRAAAAYFTYQIAGKTPELKARALKSAADFKIAIAAFEDVKTEFPQIAGQIELSRMQMIFLDHALSQIDNPPTRQFATVATSSERILTEMESMTAEIAKQIASQQTAAPATKK